MFDEIQDVFLTGTVLDHSSETGPDLIGRWERHAAWWDGRRDSSIDPYCKSSVGRIAPEVSMRTRDGRWNDGVNFASQDYLNLSSHPAVHHAARLAIDTYGVHSAGSAALMGNTENSIGLERRLAAFTGYADATIFPTGWGAGYGVVRTLIRETDHVVIDALAHACLQEGARSATRNIHSFRHLRTEEAEAHLARIRSGSADAGILIVTETLFSMDSDTPDIKALKALCERYGACLLVDVAHDLGAIGPTGRGCLELQDAIGVPDLLMGSFSKTFASNGGFVACNNPSLKLALRYNSGPLTFTNALSPVQCDIVLKCLDVIESDEGAELRASLALNVERMRSGLQSSGFRTLGQPSAIVPVVLGDSAVSRLMTRYATEAGGIVNLVEYPAVSRNTRRWRVHMMARHSPAHIDRFLAVAVESRSRARDHASWLGRKGQPS